MSGTDLVRVTTVVAVDPATAFEVDREQRQRRRGHAVDARRASQRFGTNAVEFLDEFVGQTGESLVEKRVGDPARTRAFASLLAARRSSSCARGPQDSS